MFSSLLPRLAFIFANILFFCYGCGSDKKEETTTYTFTADIQPILKNSCGMGDGTCHDQSKGDSGTDYVNSKDMFVSVAEDIKMRLATSDETLKMPKPGYDKTISASDITKITDYLGQDSHD